MTSRPPLIKWSNISTCKTILYRFCITGGIAKMVAHMVHDTQLVLLTDSEPQAIESLPESSADKDR
jgi:hypothetical protein